MITRKEKEGKELMNKGNEMWKRTKLRKTESNAERKQRGETND
jgi:hypothetical protein